MQEHIYIRMIKEKTATIVLRLPPGFAYVKVDPPIGSYVPYINAGRFFNSINRTIPAVKRIFRKEYHFFPTVINYKNVLQRFSFTYRFKNIVSLSAFGVNAVGIYKYCLQQYLLQQQPQRYFYTDKEIVKGICSEGSSNTLLYILINVAPI